MPAGVLKAAPPVLRAGRLTDQGQDRNPAGEGLAESRNQVEARPTGGCGDHAQTGARTAVPVGHRRGRELMLGQHGGDPGMEVRGVIEVFDVRAAHAEQVANTRTREVVDDEVHDSDSGGAPGRPRLVHNGSSEPTARRMGRIDGGCGFLSPEAQNCRLPAGLPVLAAQRR